MNRKFDAVNEKFETVNGKFGAVNEKFEGKFEAMNEQFADLKAYDEATRTWTLTLLVTLAAAMFGTMARGFGWI